MAKVNYSKQMIWLFFFNLKPTYQKQQLTQVLYNQKQEKKKKKNLTQRKKTQDQY